ncbi:hypothetical protein PCE1_002118 [Barthelona sp. PCE]
MNKKKHKDSTVSATEPALKVQKTSPDVYCICRTSKITPLMIGCDLCEEWFHCECLNITAQEAQELHTFICPFCKDKGITSICKKENCKNATQPDSLFCSTQCGREHVKRDLIRKKLVPASAFRSKKGKGKKSPSVEETVVEKPIVEPDVKKEEIMVNVLKTTETELAPSPELSNPWSPLKTNDGPPMPLPTTQEEFPEFAKIEADATPLANEVDVEMKEIVEEPSEVMEKAAENVVEDGEVVEIVEINERDGKDKLFEALEKAILLQEQHVKNAQVIKTLMSEKKALKKWLSKVKSLRKKIQLCYFPIELGDGVNVKCCEMVYCVTHSQAWESEMMTSFNNRLKKVKSESKNIAKDISILAHL